MVFQTSAGCLLNRPAITALYAAALALHVLLACPVILFVATKVLRRRRRRSACACSFPLSWLLRRCCSLTATTQPPPPPPPTTQQRGSRVASVAVTAGVVDVLLVALLCSLRIARPLEGVGLSLIHI